MCAKIKEEETTRKDPFKEAAAGGGKTLNLIGLTFTAVIVGGRVREPNAEACWDRCQSNSLNCLEFQQLKS